MAWKILANVLLNLGIFTLGMSLYWSFKNEHYGLVSAIVFSLALLVFLKIRLMRTVKELTKKNKK